MEQKEIQKPFILEMEEIKMELIKVINNAIQERKMPCYIVDTLLAEIVAQVKEGAKNELEMAKKQVEEQSKNDDKEVA